MAKVLVFCLCGVLLWTTSVVAADTPDPEPLEIGTAGTAYLKAVRYRRIDTEVSYFDPTRPAPELETGAKPPQPDSDSGARSSVRVAFGVPAALVLLAVTFLFLRYGGGLSVSFGREGENARRARRGAETGRGQAAPTGLAAILAITDRRAALVTLAQAALIRAVEAQGLLFQRSWTARDVLRHLPRTDAYWEDLRALVLASERVHFGGRDVSEDTFRAHVARIGPLLEEGGR